MLNSALIISQVIQNWPNFIHIDQVQFGNLLAFTNYSVFARAIAFQNLPNASNSDECIYGKFGAMSTKVQTLISRISSFVISYFKVFLCDVHRIFLKI